MAAISKYRDKWKCQVRKRRLGRRTTEVESSVIPAEWSEGSYADVLRDSAVH